jgi:hypothetical protein
VLAGAPPVVGVRQRVEFSSVVGHHLFVIGFHAMKEPNDIVLLGCEVKTALRSAFQSASEHYSRAVMELSKSIGTVHYKTLHRVAEQARRLSIEARDRLERHIAEHGCFIGGPHSIYGGNGQSHTIHERREPDRRF